jgi:hypothetical protein
MSVMDGGNHMNFRKTNFREREKERDEFWICFEVSKKGHVLYMYIRYIERSIGFSHN